ncbi:lactate utilization protein [Geoalkalibacter sp.]|uniref:lactate utilization protein n=1 Tax=Geoalkalibacter sp. TaxID=3041440 RepID=UPI00272EAA1A|nr:lactate utilization protein [Geoalkalibacter sp.]
MDEHKRWHRRQLLEEAARGLERNGFAVQVCESAEEALPFLLQQTDEARTVGFGGSMTLAALDLPARCAAADKQTLVHGRAGLSPEERRQIMAAQQSCDLFFTSTNALTLKGQLVNIDATGNRVCAMAFGPRRVIVVAGVNKICTDLDAALRRVKETACPPNARRLNFKTPCAATGLCSDCNAPDRICRITTIIDKKPRATEMLVCLINEDLGY